MELLDNEIESLAAFNPSATRTTIRPKFNDNNNSAIYYSIQQKQKVKAKSMEDGIEEISNDKEEDEEPLKQPINKDSFKTKKLK